MSPRRALDFLEWTRRVGTGIFHLHRNSVFKTVDLSLISHLPVGLVPLLKSRQGIPQTRLNLVSRTVSRIVLLGVNSLEEDSGRPLDRGRRTPTNSSHSPRDRD